MACHKSSPSQGLEGGLVSKARCDCDGPLLSQPPWSDGVCVIKEKERGRAVREKTMRKERGGSLEGKERQREIRSEEERRTERERETEKENDIPEVDGGSWNRHS